MLLGADASDLDGNKHMGIIKFPVPVLKGKQRTDKELRLKLFSDEYDDLTVVDFLRFGTRL